MSIIYPDVEISPDHVKIGDASISTNHIDGPIQVKGERGYFHRVTLTVFAENLTILNGAEFEGVPSEVID